MYKRQIEDLSPLVVDAAVAFVDDDEVEGPDGNGGVVDDGNGLLFEQAALGVCSPAFRRKGVWIPAKAGTTNLVTRPFIFHHRRAVAAAHFAVFKEGLLFVAFVEFFFAFQHRVQTLDGGDDDFGGFADDVFSQSLDGVFFSEFVVVVRANV